MHMQHSGTSQLPEMPGSSNENGPASEPHGQAGPPALIAGESAAAYNELLARLGHALAPADVLEEFWVRDIADLIWDVARLRRLKASLMATAARDGMKQVLQPVMEGNAEWYAHAWARRQEDALPKVEEALGRLGATMDHVSARTFAARIADFERIARMLMMAEARRAAALAELDRHRANFSQRLRRVLAPIENGAVGVSVPIGPGHGMAA